MIESVASQARLTFGNAFVSDLVLEQIPPSRRKQPHLASKYLAINTLPCPRRPSNSFRDRGQAIQIANDFDLDHDSEVQLAIDSPPEESQR